MKLDRKKTLWQPLGISHPDPHWLILIFFLRWTIFKVFIDFVTTLLLFFMFWFFWPQGMWDFSSLARDQTCILCTGRSRNHWTIREVPQSSFKVNSILLNSPEVVHFQMFSFFPSEYYRSKNLIKSWHIPKCCTAPSQHLKIITK